MTDKKILRLIEQSFSFRYKSAPDELNPGYTRTDLQRFGELVMEECIQVLAKNGINAEYVIKKHFGLKD